MDSLGPFGKLLTSKGMLGEGEGITCANLNIVAVWQAETGRGSGRRKGAWCEGPCFRKLTVTPKSESSWTRELPLPLQLKSVAEEM